MSDFKEADLAPMIDPVSLMGRSLEFLEYIKTKPCAVENAECYGSVVPAHIATVGAGNSKKKLSLRHYSTVPLCGKHHGEQEGKTLEFGIKYKIDLGLYFLSLVIEFLTGLGQPWHNDKGTIR